MKRLGKNAGPIARPLWWRVITIETPNQLFDAMEKVHSNVDPDQIEELIKTGEHDLFCDTPTRSGIVYQDGLGLTDSAECRELIAYWYFIDRGLNAPERS